MFVKELRNTERKQSHHGVYVVEEPVDVDLGLFVDYGIINTLASVMLINSRNYFFCQWLEPLEHPCVYVVGIDICHG